MNSKAKNPNKKNSSQLELALFAGSSCELECKETKIISLVERKLEEKKKIFLKIINQGKSF